MPRCGTGIAQSKSLSVSIPSNHSGKPRSWAFSIANRPTRSPGSARYQKPAAAMHREFCRCGDSVSAAGSRGFGLMLANSAAYYMRYGRSKLALLQFRCLQDELSARDTRISVCVEVIAFPHISQSARVGRRAGRQSHRSARGRGRLPRLGRPRPPLQPPDLQHLLPLLRLRDTPTISPRKSSSRCTRRSPPTTWSAERS